MYKEDVIYRTTCNLSCKRYQWRRARIMALFYQETPMYVPTGGGRLV